MATDNVLDRVYATEDELEEMEQSRNLSPVEYTPKASIDADRALIEKARQEIAAAKQEPKKASKPSQGIPTPTPAKKTPPSVTGEAAKGIPEGYSIQKGDTLSAVARKNNMSLGQLLKLNPQITDPDKIFVGDKINLQSPKPQTAAFEMPKGRSLNISQPVLPLGNTTPPYKMQFGDAPLETVAPEGWVVGGLRMGGALVNLLKNPANITPQALKQLNKANLAYAISGSTMTVNPARLAAAAKPAVKTVKVGNFNVTQRAAEAMGIQMMGEAANQTKGKPAESKEQPSGGFDISSASAAEFDNPTQPYEPNIFDKLIEKGLHKYVETKGYENLASNQKIFYDSVVTQNYTGPITEKDFKPEELSYIKELLNNKLKQNMEEQKPFFDEIIRLKKEMDTVKKDWTKGYPEFVNSIYKDYIEYQKTGKITKELWKILKPKDEMNYWEHYIRREKDIPTLSKDPAVIGYGDYIKETGDAEHDSALVGMQRRLTNPDVQNIIHTSLGRFKGQFDPETQGWDISEEYEFNNYNMFGATNTLPTYNETTVEGGGTIPYSLVRIYAGRKAAAGRPARPVKIKIK